MTDINLIFIIYPSVCVIKAEIIHFISLDNDSFRHDFVVASPSWHKLRKEISLSATERRKNGESIYFVDENFLH